MNTIMSYRMATFAVLAVIMVLIPSPAVSDSFTRISTYYVERLDQSGPSVPDEVDIASYVFQELGLTNEDLVGPGGEFTGVTFTNVHDIDILSSTSGFLVTEWYEVWQFGDTQTASQTFPWAAVYRLDGTPGGSANISLDYIYYNYHFNVAADSRSESGSNSGFKYLIAPAGEYSTNAKNDIYFNLLGWFFNNYPAPWDYSYRALSYDQDYPFAAFTFGGDTQTGSFNLGTMNVGDMLYVGGSLEAFVECQAYSAGVCVATSTSHLQADLRIEEISVPPSPDPISEIPEPATLFLAGAGIGFIGLATRRKRK